MRGSVRAAYLCASSIVLGGLLAAPAAAEDEANIEPVIATACAANPEGEELRRRLAEALLGKAGVLPSDILADPSLSVGGPASAGPAQRAAAYGDAAIAAVQRGSAPGAPEGLIDRMRQRLEQYTGPRSNVPLADRKLVVLDPPAGVSWLFDPARKLTIKCGEVKPPKGVIAQMEEPKKRPLFALREKVEELPLTDDAAKTAGAAKIGLKRVRTVEEDGTHKTVTSLSVAGTLGLRLTSNNAAAPVYAYGTYALSKERTKPDPDPTKKQSDGDVDALEAGFSVNNLLFRRASDLSLVGTFQAAFVDDFHHDAQRLKFRAAITPGFAGSLRPLCDIGGFSDVHALHLHFRTRCILTLEAEGGHVFHVGTADFKNRGEYLAAGGRASYEIAAPIGDDAAVLGGISYRYLPTIAGKAPDIHRWDASLKYRFWLASGQGIDLGLTWAKGTEPVSYEDEDNLELGFGIIW